LTVDPTAPQEWQEAVDSARVMLALASARFYGLVEGGPTVDVTRCEEILARGAALGYLPAPDAVERYIGGLVVGNQPERSRV